MSTLIRAVGARRRSGTDERTHPWHPCLAIAVVALTSIVARAQDAGPTTRVAEATATTTPTTKPTSRPTRRPPRPTMRHALVKIEGDAGLVAGAFDHVALVADLPPSTQPAPAATTGPTSRPVTRDGVGIVSPRHDFPLSGTWTSETIRADFPFTELLPSWNAIVPDGTGVRFDVRVRAAGTKDDWSPWLYVGYWGRITRDHTRLEFDGGKVDVDTLMLTKPADAFEVRATLMNYDLAHPRLSPTLRRVSAAYSRNADPAAPSTPPDEPAATRPTSMPAATSIPVPFRAQGWEDDAIRHSICSPTSVSMVLASLGDALPTAQNAVAIWDDDNGLFGNWNRAVQYAGSLGYDAWLQRFETMDDVRRVLATGQPVIASIRFGKGEFPSNLQNATDGHLIVVRGFDANGDLICNDPASRTKGEAIVYKSDELARAWLLNVGGVGYIIKKPG